MFKHGGGKKSITDLDGQPGSGKKLADWIENTFGGNDKRTKVGGAAAQTADFLRGIGEDNVTVYTLFNSPSQANAYNNSSTLNFLGVDGDNPVVKNIKEATVDDDPTKTSYPIERTHSISVKFNGKMVDANNKADRVIFTGEYYDKNGKVINFDPLLNFSPQALEKIGKEFEYFFATGPYYLQRLSGAKYDEISTKMIEQLKILKSAGVKILIEFSGNAANVKYFPDVLKGNIHSLSMNDDKELRDIVNSIKTNIDPNIEVDNGNGIYANYKNAIALADYLGLERLHVHGQNSDITVRKNASEKDLNDEARALMFSKQRVTEWIQGKPSMQITPEDELPTRILKYEGYCDVLKLASALKNELFPQSNPPSKDIVSARAKLLYSFIKKGYYKNEGGYSVVVIPNKWIYDRNKVLITTSAGDITAITAAVHSGL